ncbi:exocyst complex component Sec6-domain-containing protein [Thamnocephalis sphaerospora]|uniref:Exocyst complex component Sec6-domain-containing protein n=1 Tax=Thamnocephalis sphaerospora TaxID=78915 RepID=A0A4P9XSH1_9FUNG|nr:exocyst complex component Sec6-domain-containing protein [Thamnocephalis sphaerospora]|eukprot:RKP08932.1 exocyst complex component Sec6-domain-containing protein [Thamnocephalis sphaerospora]
MTDAPVEAAVARLKEVLRHPDDLEVKVNILRRRLMQEKATIDAQLKNGAQAHFDGIQRGLELLRGANERSETLRRRLRAASELRFGTRELSEHYVAITQISRVHENMSKTRRLVDQFRELEDKLQEATGLFEDIQRSGQATGRDLLRLHYRVSHLEMFRDSVMRDSQSVTRDTLRALQRTFERLEEIAENFAQFYWGIVGNLLDYAGNEDGEMIVAIAKVVEAEEAADEKALETWKNEQPEPDPDPANGPLPKAWREQLFVALRTLVADQFQRWQERFAEEPFTALDETEFMLDDLSLVFDIVVPRFPKKYKIFPFFTLEYHQQLARHIARIAAMDLDAGQILRLLRWTREYYTSMKKQLGIAEKVLQPKLLEGHEETLIKDYLRLVRAKLDEWMANLVKVGSQDFSERARPPEQDVDGTYGVGAAVIIFQMINEQVEVATESNRGNILADVVVECAGAMRTTQAAWKKLIDTELKRHVSGKEMPGGLVEYMVALSNEQLRCVDFCDTITDRSSEMVNAKYAERIQNATEEARNGFLDIGRHGCSCIVDIVLHDMKPIFAELFCAQWYDEDLCDVLVVTLRDYCEDFRTTMKEYLFGVLVDNLLDRFLLAYLSGPFNKEAALHMPDMDDRMQDDLGKVYDFFSDYFSAEQLGDAFAPVDALRQLITAPPEEMPDEFSRLREAYPDAPIWLADKTTSKRADIEKAQAKEIMEVIKKTHGKQKTDVVTVFGQLKK